MEPSRGETRMNDRADMTYGQPAKKAAREALLATAVGNLTTDRKNAVVVREAEFDEVLAFARPTLKRFFREVSAFESFNRELDVFADEWRRDHRKVTNPKRAEDLRVLYLCGPEPLNDLQLLVDMGIDPRNCWGIESDRAAYQRARESLANSGWPMHLYNGDLKSFLELVPERFDIIYYDACGPLAGGSPNTLPPLLRAILFSRLEPLSALVTNFAFPSDDERYEGLYGHFFHARYNDVPAFLHEGIGPEAFENDPEGLGAFLARDAEETYSEFVTRFVVDLARTILPNAKALSVTEIARDFFEQRSVLNETMASALRGGPTFEDIGAARRTPFSFPLLHFFQNLETTSPNDPVINALREVRHAGKPLLDTVKQSSLLEHFVEIGPGVAGGALVDALKNSWFDRGAGWSCDEPFPHLLINSVLGSYGYPFHPNTRASLRLKYRAKSTTMFSDCLILDQCRYFYEMVPGLDLVKHRFKYIPLQILLRVQIDRMSWNDHGASAHPFSGGALAGHGETPNTRAYFFSRRTALPVVQE